jgi:hypothetical protein
LDPQRYASLEDAEEVLGNYLKENTQLILTQEELFANKEVGDYRLNVIDGLPEGITIPKEIAELLGWDPEKKGLGAFSQ